MNEPPLRAPGMSPKCAFLIQSSKLLSAVRPRVRVISPAFGRPGSFLLTYFPSAVLCLSSIASTSSLIPETSWICLMATPSISKPNDQPTLVSRSGRPMDRYLPSWSRVGCGLLGERRSAGELGQAEDHELGRLY